MLAGMGLDSVTLSLESLELEELSLERMEDESSCLIAGSSMVCSCCNYSPPVSLRKIRNQISHKGSGGAG